MTSGLTLTLRRKERELNFEIAFKLPEDISLTNLTLVAEVTPVTPNLQTSFSFNYSVQATGNGSSGAAADTVQSYEVDLEADPTKFNLAVTGAIANVDYKV